MNRSLFADYRDSLRRPAFWIYSTWLEIVTKYRRSRLGIIWAIVPSALYTFGVGSFYSSISGHSIVHFIPHMGLGYVVFRLIIVSLSEGTTACASHASYIHDGRIRLTDYMLRVMAKALFYFVVALPVIVAALAVSDSFAPLGLLTVLPALCIVLLNVAWMIAVIAILGARLPDVSQLIGSILMFSFLFTPILWRADQVPFGTLKGTIARANPLFHMVEVVRAPLLGERLEPTTLLYLVVMLAFGWTLAALVYRKYAKFVPVWI